jgi:hypothetical protein
MSGLFGSMKVNNGTKKPSNFGSLKADNSTKKPSNFGPMKVTGGKGGARSGSGLNDLIDFSKFKQHPQGFDPQHSLSSFIKYVRPKPVSPSGKLPRLI